MIRRWRTTWISARPLQNLWINRPYHRKNAEQLIHRPDGGGWHGVGVIGLHGVMTTALRTTAATTPSRLVGAPRGTARLREDQWRAVEALVAQGRRALVVQRTGWGKSAVYFVATALLRERGSG